MSPSRSSPHSPAGGLTAVAVIVVALVAPVFVLMARHAPEVDQRVVGTWTGIGGTGTAREALGRPATPAQRHGTKESARPRPSEASRAPAATFVWPVGGSWAITSPFGPRGEDDQMHHGLDIGCALGSPVVPALPGRVLFAGDAGAYGNTVVLDHGDTWMTLYAHLDEIDVRSGAWAAPRQVIGRCGSTGRSTGPHLHLEVRYGGYVWDPLHYLPA